MLWLDADEEATAELAEEIPGSGRKGRRRWKINRRVWYLGRWIDGCGWYPDYNLRLFKKDQARFSFRINNNDTVDIDGRAKGLKNPINHYPYRDLAHHIGKLNHYTSMLAGQMRREGQSSVDGARRRSRDVQAVQAVRAAARLSAGAQGCGVPYGGFLRVFEIRETLEQGLGPGKQNDEPR